jgi:hypothetical protein
MRIETGALRLKFHILFFESKIFLILKGELAQSSSTTHNSLFTTQRK